MKYLILRCEDRAHARPQTTALLEGAKVSKLQQLAQAGSAGLIRAKSGVTSVDRLALHRSFFGIDTDSPKALPGFWYAASSGVDLKEGESAWCCDFVTQHEGKILDLTAGHITTKESEILIKDLNRQLGSQTRRWILGCGSHHCLVTRDDRASIESASFVPAPELLVNKLWKRRIPTGTIGIGLQHLIEQSSKLLEAHPVNKVRVDLGENPANMAWLWGLAYNPSGKTQQQANLGGLVISSAFPMQGFARCLGLEWKKGPTSLNERDLKRSADELVPLIEEHDITYFHIQIDASDALERLCVMERFDQLVIKPITESLAHLESFRVLVAIDDLNRGWVSFVAFGKGLPSHPVAHIDAEHLLESQLIFQEGAQLHNWFTSPV